MPTMNQSCRVFPTGAPVPGTPSSKVLLTGGSSDTLTTPYEISEAGSSYVFIFWNVDATLTPPQETAGTPDPEQTVTFTAPSDDSTFGATAWYVLVGSGGSSEIWAFSLNKDEVLPNSPIATITPASAQTGPNTFTTGPEPVVVTAPTLIVGDGLFRSWLQYSGNGAVAGRVLTVPANGGSAAIAFYGIPVPDPCQGIRDELVNITPEDFPNFADYERAIQAVRAQLVACEERYGETPVP